MTNDPDLLLPAAPESVDVLAPAGLAAAEQLIELTVRQHPGGVVVVTVTGEADMLTAPLLHTYLERRLAERCRVLVLDLSRVGFLGSSGLAVLVQTLRGARRREAELRLVCPTRAVARPLRSTGLDQVFALYPSVSAAIAG